MSETTDGTDLPESNVFAKPWPLDLGLPGFTAVDHADIEPAIRAGMAAERQEWEAIATNDDAPTIANTVDALERSGELLERALTVLDALTSATDCPDLDELEEALAPELAAHSDAYHLDSRLYRRFKVLDELVAQAPEGQCARDADGTVIDAETSRLIRLTVEEFERNGVDLDEADTQVLKEINARVNALKMRFSVLVTEAMHAAGVTNVTVPPALATTRPHGARLTLLETSMSRGLGEQGAFGDTRGIVLELARLRAERAVLLGFPHHAALVAAESAARTTEAVSELLGRLTAPAMDNARADAQVYAARMDLDPQTQAGETFGPADWPLYEAAERKERFGVDDEVLAPYLELWSVVTKGVFYAANRLYGITFHEREDLAEHMYAPGVKVWEVRDGEDAQAPVLGLFVGDYYARAGKSGGAWMDSLVTGSTLTGRKPVVINCCNIEQPTSGPVLLTWDEVITCFHEFGHALHALFSQAATPRPPERPCPATSSSSPASSTRSGRFTPRCWPPTRATWIPGSPCPPSSPSSCAARAPSVRATPPPSTWERPCSTRPGTPWPPTRSPGMLPRWRTSSIGSWPRPESMTRSCLPATAPPTSPTSSPAATAPPTTPTSGARSWTPMPSSGSPPTARSTATSA